MATMVTYITDIVKFLLTVTTNHNTPTRPNIPSCYHSYFACRRSRSQISARKPVIPLETFHGFLESLQNCLQIWPRSLPSISRLDKPGIETQFVAEARDVTYNLSKNSRTVLERIQPPIQCVPWAFPGDESAGSYCWQIHLHLDPRLRMSGAIPPLPYTCSWCAFWKFYLYL
jgi:hypothetical protein